MTSLVLPSFGFFSEKPSPISCLDSTICKFPGLTADQMKVQWSTIEPQLLDAMQAIALKKDHSFLEMDVEQIVSQVFTNPTLYSQADTLLLKLV